MTLFQTEAKTIALSHSAHTSQVAAAVDIVQGSVSSTQNASLN